MYEQVIPPNEVKQKNVKRGTIHQPLTDKEVREISYLNAVRIDDVVTPVDPLAVHIRQFRAKQHTRLLRVQQMSLAQQNKYYRELGYF